MLVLHKRHVSEHLSDEETGSVLHHLSPSRHSITEHSTTVYRFLGNVFICSGLVAVYISIVAIFGIVRDLEFIAGRFQLVVTCCAINILEQFLYHQHVLGQKVATIFK